MTLVKEIILISAEKCPKCEPMKKIVKEVSEDSKIPFKIIKIPIDNELEVELLENQICVMITPSIILRTEEKLICVKNSIGTIMNKDELIKDINEVN